MAENGMQEAVQETAEANSAAVSELESSPAPTLTLDPFGSAPKAELVPELKTEPAKAEMAEARLTPEEMKMVDDFATQIDITDSNTVMTYGAATQQKMADFSDKALDNVRTKDMGEIGELLTGVVTELKGFNMEEEKGILGFFKKQGNKLATMKTKYDKAEVNVNRIVDVLQEHETRLMKDSATLDKMYDMNLTYYKELSMYILAGKKKLEEAEKKVLPEMQKKAQESHR